MPERNLNPGRKRLPIKTQRKIDAASENQCNLNQDSGPPWQARKARFGPCLDFGFQCALIRNNRSKKFGLEYWALPGSNLHWHPCYVSGSTESVSKQPFQLIVELNSSLRQKLGTQV